MVIKVPKKDGVSNNFLKVKIVVMIFLFLPLFGDSIGEFNKAYLWTLSNQVWLLINTHFVFCDMHFLQNLILRKFF